MLLVTFYYAKGKIQGKSIKKLMPINKIKIFYIFFKISDYMDPDKTLEDYSIFGDNEYILYYEYKPVMKAILG